MPRARPIRVAYAGQVCYATVYGHPRRGGRCLAKPFGRVEDVCVAAYVKEMAMKKRASLVKNETWCRWPVAAVIAAAVTVVPLTAVGADRMVLCEEFTSTT